MPAEQTTRGFGLYDRLLLLAQTLHIPSGTAACAEDVKEEEQEVAANTVEAEIATFGQTVDADPSKFPALVKESLAPIEPSDYTTMTRRQAGKRISTGPSVESDPGKLREIVGDEHAPPELDIDNDALKFRDDNEEEYVLSASGQSEALDKVQTAKEDDHASSNRQLEVGALDKLLLDAEKAFVSVPYSEGEEDALDKLKIPRTLPTIIDIKKAIPAHCFESSTPLSLYFMVKDFFLVGICFVLINWTWEVLPPFVQLVITPAYWLVQGTLFTAVFVIGHDAGHGSFSSNELVNLVCGNICHTVLLTPYYMWKVSHKNHHKNTGNMDKDEVFYPVRKKDSRDTVFLKGFGLAIGWFMYLVRGYGPRQVYHLNPLDPMFTRHVFHCCVSLVCLAGWVMCLLYFTCTYGWWALAYHYGMPEMVFGSYIVIITFLHHSDKEVPWYADSLWNNVRGQLSSVDRSYGWCHEILHNIGTHQIHHLFPRIPHYHLEEATVYFRKNFPALVQKRDDPIMPAFWRIFAKYAKQCVADDEAKIHLYE